MDDNIYNELKKIAVGAQDDVLRLVSDRDALLKRKPFTRGAKVRQVRGMEHSVPIGSEVHATLSGIRREVISQDQYISELDPYMHDVLFDENIPSICVKRADGNFKTIEFVRTAIPFQQSIMQKQTLHMACMPMKFTLSDKQPSESQQSDFVTFKHYWDLRNQDGMKVKMVATAKSYGDAAILYYINRHGEVKSRLLSYGDGYVICSHDDDNGERMLESIYYESDGVEYIDSYDEKYMYRMTSDENGEQVVTVESHSFGEIPVITKRTSVAWEHAQTLIESYEIIYNIFQVLQKKWGWGMLYIKGRIEQNAQKIAGNIVLNDTSTEGKGDAKFLEPPAPQNMIDTLDHIFKRIQIASGTTFILPNDIHTSGETSGIAVQMTQSLDMQTAKNGIVEWQNVADKMVRLFKRGLAIEMIGKGRKKDAVTEFDKLNINASFDVWQPYSESEYNNMLCTMKNSGIISEKTAIETNTISRPDEVERIGTEREEAERKSLEAQQSTLTTSVVEEPTEE